VTPPEQALARSQGITLRKSTTHRWPFTANDLSFLEAVANVIAAAIARARIEEQLRLAERRTVEERGRSEQAEAALRERDEFISVAAHELRTPLTALQLKLQGLERGLAAADPRRFQRLEGAVRQTERLSRLIDRLLDVSRIAQGRLDLWLEEFVKLEVEQERVWLAVRDQGIGIPAEDVSRIFGRFQRAASIRNYGGLGLGLYITRYIVEAHRGTIAVASSVGEGSTFSIDLPRFGLAPAANRNRIRGARA